MESFTFGWPRTRMLYGLARNDLLRSSDRIESLVATFLALVVIIAVPVAAAIGTAVHERRALIDAEYTASLHQTEATVTGDGLPRPAPLGEVVYLTTVRWDGNGRDHTAAVAWPERVRTGDHVMLWLDRSGQLKDAPPTADRAVQEGITIAAVLWAAVAGAAAGTLRLLRWRLDVVRFAKWDREIAALVDDGSRH